MAGEWEDVSLEDVADEITVGYVGSMASEYVDGGVPFLRSQNIEPLRINKKDLKYITPEFHKRIRKSRLSPGDVVIVRTGKPGACSVVPPWFSDGNCSDLVIVRCGERINSNFLAYYINTAATHHVSSHLVGALQQHFNVGAARTLRFNLPPLAEQKRIAHILGTLDDKIELNRRMNATLETMVRALFQSWFVDFDPVRRNAEGVIPRLEDSLFPDSFEDSAKGEIPKGWIPTTLGKEADFSTGFAFKSKSFVAESDVRLARGDNVKEGFFHWDSKARYWPEISPDLERHRLQVGDVLMGMDVSKVGKNWVRVRRCDLPCLLVQRVACLREKNTIGQLYLWILVSDSRFRNFVDAVKTGTSIPHISGGQIKAFDLVRPPAGDNRVFKRFEELVGPLGEQIDANIEQSQTLSALRDALLPRLLSGELSIP